MKRIFKFTSLAIFCCILHTSITLAETQTLNNNPIEEVKESIRFRVEHGYNVGIVVGVVSPTGTEYFSYGKTAVSGEQTVNENTVFEIGSITKVFTALLLADMVEKGDLSFHDPIEKYLPNSVSVPKRKNQSIKLIHLAMLSSGLPMMPDNLDPTKNPDNPLASYTVEQMYDFLSNFRLKYDIGTQCEYSNCGHALLGHILSLKNGTSYEGLVKERIASELGMTSTTIELTQEMRNRLAKPHAGVVEIPDFELSATFAGSGALRSTARDMVKFLEACLGLKSTRLQPAFKTIYELLREPPGTYEKPAGSVWSLRTNGDQTIRWFEGITLGQHSFIGFSKEEQKGVVVLSNTREEIKDIGFHLLNADSPLLEWPAPAKVSAKKLKSYAGRYQLESEEIKVLLQNGHLVLVKKWNQIPIKCMLHAKSESEFWNRAFGVQITFQIDAKGEVISLLLQEGESEEKQKAKKIGGKAVKPSAEPSHTDYAKLIEPEKLKGDLDFLFKTIEEVHPNMYAYTSKQEFSKYCDKLYRQINRPMNSREFYKLVAPTVASLKNGHTSICPFPLTGNDKIFPIGLRWDGQDVILQNDYAGNALPLGGKILTINGKDARKVIQKLARYSPDEYQETNLREIERPGFLWIWLLVEYDKAESLDLRIKAIDGRVKDYVVKAVPLEQVKKHRQYKQKENYTYRYIPEYSTGLIEFNQFADIETFEKFLQGTFKKLKEQGASNLIIDIRENRGGNSSLGDALLDYLTDKPFRQFEEYLVKVSAQADNLWRIRQNMPQAKAQIGSLVTIDVPFKKPRDNPLRFNDRKFVLIGQTTFSSANCFASAIKCFNIATLIGEETGGTTTSYGDCLSFYLPNSNLGLDVAHKYFVEAGGKPDGRGVIPDYEVKQKPEDIAKGIDTVMQFTLNLIKKGELKK